MSRRTHPLSRVTGGDPGTRRGLHQTQHETLPGLRWEDLDLVGGTASIRRTLQHSDSSGLIALPTKTKSSERRIALPTPCLCSLKQHRDRQRKKRKAAGTG